MTRVRWGGSLLEEARLHGSPKILTVAPHTQPAAEIGAVETLDAPDDGSPKVLERVEESTGGVSLRDAKVVVSGGRGVGSSEGFAIIEELAGLLGGAVGCSRVVTSAGWRPHADQVGQTGTKISADLYVACGISGATQHIAGAKGAKKILAINTDPEAPIFASADYAVIGDLHEIVPAISAELREGARIGAIGLAALVLVVRRALRAPRALPDAARRCGAAERPAGRRAARASRNEAEIVLGQKKLLQRLVPGLMHAFIFWGFLVLFPTIVARGDRRRGRARDDAGVVPRAERRVRGARARRRRRPRSSSARSCGRRGSTARTSARATSSSG